MKQENTVNIYVNNYMVQIRSADLTAKKIKNRFVNISEATRVSLQHLSIVINSRGSYYINSNFIDGFRYKKAKIASDASLIENIGYFWRML